jgi:spore coat polysaccharide biosynthesis protein SpsF
MRDSHPIVAVIQARMSSSRLPGKVLLPVAGKPLLWHIVHRLGQCRMVDRIAVATSADASDDPIEAFCAGEAVTCVRGSLTNVLDRYRLAAEQTGARTLLRVTGDSPLIDPGFVDYLTNAMVAGGGDYAVIQAGALCAHEGVDAFSREALDWLVRNAGDDPMAREHVSSYFRLHPETVRTVVAPSYAPLELPHSRFTVDTADDLALIRVLYERLGAAPGELRLTEALALMRDDPALRQINSHVRQKAIGQKERHALVVCQGGSSAGLGHVRRSLSLARALRDIQGYGVTLGVKGEESAVQLIRAASFETVPLQSARDLAMLSRTGKFSLAIVDIKDWLTRGEVAALADDIPVLAVIDDISDRRLAASHAYYPPVPQAASLSWAGSQCLPRIGWEWCVLGFDPARLAVKREAGGRPSILVSMGGADPLRLTDLALEALRQVQRPLRADFVIGPAFSDTAGVIARIGSAGPDFRALTGITDLSALIAGADLALISFGVTAYEAAALGVPALYLPISASHALSASIFVAAGLGLAMAEKPSVDQIAGALARLIDDDEQRKAMRERGPKLVDGRGAVRIAQELAGAVEALEANPRQPPPARAR